jgi:two-component system, cell cycle response regulator
MDSKPLVLIVDDEPLNLRVSAECLANHYTIFFARSGQEALDLLPTQPVDVILLDINMPEMDGFQTARKICELDPDHEIPIIYLTADTSEDTISKAFDNGAADYIIKPFKQKELLARVKNRIETERLKKEQRKLILRNSHLVEIINRHVAYIKTDPEGIITEISPNFCELIQCNTKGYETCAQHYVGQNVNILKSEYTHKANYRALWDTIEKGKIYTHDIENRNFNHETNWHRVTIIPDVDEKGMIEGYVAFYQNIDDQIQLEHDAHTDFLTGIHNRSKFEKLLSDEITRSNRYGVPLSIIMVDIDHFKDVNDVYGHLVGDIILKEFSDIIQLSIRQNDLFARWGGEEFIILCPHTDIEGTRALAEMLREKIERYHFTKADHKTASFGVAQYNDGMDANTLFFQVDTALYEAKESGRNCVRTYTLANRNN